uniref:Disease resistance protein At4g11170 family n=1 Tax=Cajanus cajan TaxID=3821 RepID=A0A151TXC6_CAJCA|nr:Putative disease resistance protein At4g11170 family [Cajanus cajan]
MHESKLKKLRNGVQQNLVNLKIIYLWGSRDLIEVPDLSKAERLEVIFLYKCVSLCQLHVHSKSLRRLFAEGCSSLKEFSVTSEEIKELNLAGTTICALQPSIWPKITFLSLKDCNNLKFIGNNIVHLSSLEILDLSRTNISSLLELPPSLQLLMAINCTSLESDFTQQLVLKHMLQSHIPYIHQQYLDNPAYNDDHAYFLFLGDHVTKRLWDLYSRQFNNYSLSSKI